jgi:hypothetical protein
MSNRALAAVFVLATFAFAVPAQEMPTDYRDVLNKLKKQGDYKDNVLKINIPRNDLAVSVDGVPIPTPFGFGGWLAMTKGSGGHHVMMGDLVLLQEEVNPVMTAMLDNGLEVTALHNHFFFEEPRIFYMHVMGHGTPQELAQRAKPGLDLIGTIARHQTRDMVSRAKPGTLSGTGQLDTAKIAKIVGRQGEQNGTVYKITVGRDDLTIEEMGARINSRMGLNTWAAFTGSDQNAAIAGDVAMLESEVQPVLKALRANNLSIVAIHQHMLDTQPNIVFLHYWGTGPAEKLATGFRAALDQLGKNKRGAAVRDNQSRPARHFQGRQAHSRTDSEPLREFSAVTRFLPASSN